MMRPLRATLAAALLALGSLPSLALDRGPPAQVLGPVKAPSINLTGTDSTGVISGMSAKRPGGVSRLLSDILDNTLDVRDFGARDDDETPDTDAFNAAAAAASAKGRTLKISASASGTGKYRIGTVNWQSANLEIEEGVQLLNLDGTRYAGGFTQGGGNGLFGVGLTGPYKYGRRISSIGGQSMAFTKPGDREANFLTFTGNFGMPYAIVSALRDFSLIGQGAPTSASFASSGRFVNVYNVSNGPGFNITCTATAGSNVLTACTPSPTGTHTATNPDGSPFSLDGGATAHQIPNVYNPCKVSGGSIPNGTSVGNWDAGAISMVAPGSYTEGAAYPGPTAAITVNLQCGRAEINHASWHIDAIGRKEQGGPAGGLNFYNDSFATTNISDDPADQEGFLTPFEFISSKQVPGLRKDKLHSGSYGLVVPQIPVAGNKTYPMHDGLAITGWSGAPGIAGGLDPNATPAAINGLRVGGECASVFCYPYDRSYYQVGIRVEDYNTGMIFDKARPGGSGTALYVAPGAGNIDVRDNLIVGTSIIEAGGGTPASSTAPCTRGQRTWDANYEYRCVAANTWKRAALSTW